MKLRLPVPQAVTPKAVLEGCPGDLVKVHKIKVFHNGGYEHFERVEQSLEFGPESQPAFRWVMRTEVAE
jgi:Family of unknown function (DUF5988)